MDAVRRKLRRLQLDSQLGPLAGIAELPVPKGGWLRAIRESLGMSLEQYARRLRVASGSTAYQLEHAEVNESITVKRMRAAADALGCDLIVALVPREPLEKQAEEQAMRKAVERLSRVGHTMAMESQSVGGAEMEEFLRQTASDLLARGGARLWE